KGLIERNPKADWWKAHLAGILGDRGDIELRDGKLSEAEKCYRESFDYLKPGLKAVPTHAPYQLQHAQHYERMATLAARKGNKAEEKKDYDEAFAIRKELFEIDPNNTTWQGALLRMMAHSGRADLAVRNLEMLCRNRPRSIALLVDAARA